MQEKSIKKIKPRIFLTVIMALTTIMMVVVSHFSHARFFLDLIFEVISIIMCDLAIIRIWTMDDNEKIGDPGS